MWQSWIGLILGAWLFASGWVPGLQAPGNMAAVGALSVIFGFWAIRKWQTVVIGIIGIWLLLASLFFFVNQPSNYFIPGAVIFLLGVWGAASGPRRALPEVHSSEKAA